MKQGKGVFAPPMKIMEVLLKTETLNMNVEY